MRVRRALAAGALSVVLAAAGAVPAAAHTRTNTDQHLRSVLVSAPDGLSVTVTPDGSSITIEADREVTVLGYDGEPFLRFDDRGVWANRQSDTAYDALPEVTERPDGSGTTDASWQLLVAGDGYSWPDHRTSWHGTELPAEVVADPGTGRTVGSWSIPLVLGGGPAAVTGEVHWIPTTESVALTVAVCVGVLGLILALAVAVAFPRRRQRVRVAAPGRR